ncbi:OLC1v1030458C1 [Oldenlandia corymbosa var. corymbosa]|uniref:OLC1v1030458C1 n=1 Tax=Oldenlandia corymbosa var. corymbosa TaxID=529605 RepID=A0AAV1CI31_OLDCO|nr:OLC1v1030458C1 [Oldenlandia corymbosa var. corymbosa]
MQQFIFLFSLFLLLPFFLLLSKRLKIHETQKPLPPGPSKLPFIGNLHQMFGSLPHHTLQKLSQKHGPLMHLQLGELPTVIVSSPKLAKEVLQTHGLIFADRPNLTVARVMSRDNNCIVSFAPYGDYWRQMRQIYIGELLNAKSIWSFSSILEDELSNLMKSIQSQKGKQIVFGEMIMSCLYSTICRTTAGRKEICRDDKEALIMTARETGSLTGVFNLGDLFPSSKLVQFMVSMKPYRLNDLRNKIDGILENIINHRENSKTNDDSEEDILDILLRLEKRNDSQFTITRDHIKAIIFELSIAGSLTSSVLVEWAMSELIKHPRVMERTQSEIREALKGKERITTKDTTELKYLNFVIKETLRLHPPGPLLAPRQSREQCEIGGYMIPAGTIAVINAWAIGRDPECWNDPEEFRPERFQDSSVNFMGTDFELIPFGAGRRICPGINYGVNSIQLLLSHLLYHFNWKLPPGIKPGDLDMTERFGGAVSRKHGLRLLAEAYNE